MPLEVVSQFFGGDEECEEEFLLHRVPLVSIAQHSADEVYGMLNEGRLGCGSTGFLGRFVGARTEACLWRVLNRGSRGRLGRER